MKTMLFGGAALAPGLISVPASAQLGVGGGAGLGGAVGGSAGGVGSSLGGSGSLGLGGGVDAASGNSSATLGAGGSLGTASRVAGSSAAATGNLSLDTSLSARTPGTDAVKGKLDGTAAAADRAAGSTVNRVKSAQRKTQRTAQEAPRVGVSASGRAGVASKTRLGSPGGAD